MKEIHKSLFFKGKKSSKNSKTATNPPKEYRIALAGNPNVGKSTVFNALTGLKQHTGNWPGKTVGIAEGKCAIGHNICTFIDVPGTYSLTSHSPEEEVAREVLRSDGIDAIIAVCDATCLERNLVLILQILEIGKPTLICVNLLDEAKRKAIEVDPDRLSILTGAYTAGAVARKRGGLRDVTAALEKMLDDMDRSSDGESPKGLPPLETEDLVKKAAYICKEAKKEPPEAKNGRASALDRLFTGKKTAFPIMLALLLAIFWITIAGANYPSAYLSAAFAFLGEKLGGLLRALSPPDWLYGLLMDGVYGVVSKIVSVMLPPMAIFFPLFTILEDSGYLPRIAFNLDRPFQKCNTCGKQALTMCMGFGCNAVGVMGCRIIDSPRERTIAIVTNSFVPCNGRFPLLVSLISVFFVGTLSNTSSTFVSALLLTLFILLSVAVTLLISKLLSVTVLRGLPSAFTLELPPYRSPQIGKVIVRSIFDRTLFVLGRAVSAAIPAGILLWGMATLRVGDQSLLSLCSGYFDPFAQLLGLDGVILIAFLLAFPANEIVIPIILMAYTSCGTLVEQENLFALKSILISNGWTVKTALCVILFSLFHWPCATTLLTVKKEAGFKWAFVSALIPTVCGMFLCALVNLAFTLLK